MFTQKQLNQIRILNTKKHKNPMLKKHLNPMFTLKQKQRNLLLQQRNPMFTQQQLNPMLKKLQMYKQESSILISFVICLVICIYFSLIRCLGICIYFSLRNRCLGIIRCLINRCLRIWCLLISFYISLITWCLGICFYISLSNVCLRIGCTNWVVCLIIWLSNWLLVPRN